MSFEIRKFSSACLDFGAFFVKKMLKIEHLFLILDIEKLQVWVLSNSHSSNLHRPLRISYLQLSGITLEVRHRKTSIRCVLFISTHIVDYNQQPALPRERGAVLWGRLLSCHLSNPHCGPTGRENRSQTNFWNPDPKCPQVCTTFTVM